MTNILTAAEAANAVRTTTDDQIMLDLLSSVDVYIKNSTGRDWTSDSPIHPEAKAAARLLLVQWYDNNDASSLGVGLRSVLTQLEALALQYANFEGLSGSGYVELPGAREGDQVESVTGLTAGHTGDQSAAFESVIEYDGLLRQISADNLDDCFFRVHLVPLSDQ